MKKAFTIIELLVAMALLAMLVAISAVVFSVAIKAFRTAGATSEIMAKMRSITEQLDADFQGMRTDMPVAIWVEKDSAGRRYDQIQFFADGVFQSSRQWNYSKLETPEKIEGSVTLEGNTARVYYGHANQGLINATAKTRSITRAYNAVDFSDSRQRCNESVLARRCHLMSQVSMPATATFPTILSAAAFSSTFVPWYDGRIYGNDVFEYDNLSLSQWKALLNDPANARQYIETCFGKDGKGTCRPIVDLAAADGQSLHMILSQGVGSFQIQIGRWNGITKTLEWTNEPSTFGAGRYYHNKAPFAAVGVTSWDMDSGGFVSVPAIKFTFTLYDSSGVFATGKTFTHIVYLNN